MKPSVLAAVVALGLTPLAALAEGADAAPAAAPAQTAPWSLGAGAGWGPFYGLQTAYLGGPGAVPPAAPTVRASLERAVRTGWWLELGFGGDVQRLRGDAPDGIGRTTRNDAGTAALNLGLRRALTAPGAPVCVSVDLALVAGYTAFHIESAALTTTQVVRGEAVSLGLATGLAVERELTSGLSLRVGTSLLEAWWTSASVKDSVYGEVTRKGGNASLALSPWLELRQAF